MLIAGIDPGRHGGLAFIGPEGLETFPLGELWELVNLLQMKRPTHVFVEAVHAMPGNGVTSMFSFGRAYGEILGVLTTLGLPTSLLPPQVWTKSMHQNAHGDKPKARSLWAAQVLWPAHSWLATARSRVPHDGMVDAALIAEYGRRQLAFKA